MSRIPLVDLERQRRNLSDELDAAIGDVLQRGDFIQGESCERFERAFADYLGVRHALGVGNGTDALVLALLATGVGSGDEVITAANTFTATAEAILIAGAVPVFADVDDHTLCLDPAAFERAITPRTAAVIPIHLHGHPAAMASITDIAAHKGVKVIEDAAQAQGCVTDGRRAGAIGDAGCFSFYPSKNLGAFGDGGLVSTDDEALAAIVRATRNHGRGAAGADPVVGRCSRLDSIQAAVLAVKLPHLESWNEQRRTLARQYDRRLGACADLTLPPRHSGAVYHHYAIRTHERDALGAALAADGIATGVHYACSLPLEPSYTRYRTAPTPVADQSCDEVLSLPIFPEMTPHEVDEVAAAVLAFFDDEHSR